MKTNDSIKENNEILNNKAQQLPEDKDVYIITFLPGRFDANTCDYAKDIMNALRRNIGMFNIDNTYAEEKNVIILTHKPSEELLKQIKKFVIDRKIDIYGLLQILKIDTKSDLSRVLKLVTTNKL